MASRRGFFSYDPYDYYYAPSYSSSYPYYAHPHPPEPFFYPHHRRPSSQSHPTPPAPNHRVFHTEPAARDPMAARREHTGCSKTSFPVEVTGPDPDPPAPKRSAEEAAVRLQAAARGLMSRKTVREVRAVEREAEAVAAHSDALRSNARARVGVNEELMRLLLRLDGVRGAREYRRRVTKRVLALQDAVDALDSDTTPPAMVTDAPEAAQDSEDDTGMALELPVEASTEENSPAAEAGTSMEVDGVSPAPAVVGEDDSDRTEPEPMAEGEKAAEEEGEWEMVATGDSDVEEGSASSTKEQQQQQEQAGEEEKKTEVASAADGLDAKKLMEMVAALCERSAQQCALIGALAERVDTLERAVRRVEEADRRRRRAKKINKETRKIVKSFYSD